MKNLKGFKRIEVEIVLIVISMLVNIKPTHIRPHIIKV